MPSCIVWPPLRAVATAFLATFTSLALPGWTLAVVDFTKSTGNQSYNDGMGHSMPYGLFLPDGYNAPGAK